MRGRGGRVRALSMCMCDCVCFFVSTRISVCLRTCVEARTGTTSFLISGELVAIQSDPPRHRSIHSPGPSTGPFLRAKCCCAGKTGPPGVPEREPFNPLYLFAAHKALRPWPISHHCLLHSQYFLKLRPQQEQALL